MNQKFNPNKPINPTTNSNNAGNGLTAYEYMVIEFTKAIIIRTGTGPSYVTQHAIAQANHLCEELNKPSKDNV